MTTNCLNILMPGSTVFLNELLMTGIVYHMMSYSHPILLKSNVDNYWINKRFEYIE